MHSFSSNRPATVPDGRRKAIRAWLRLSAVVCGVALVWCFVLPGLAKRPAMQQHLVFLDENGIDPSAMFYTECDSMDALLKKLEGRDD